MFCEPALKIRIGLQYKELFRYRFKKGGHINVLECRVYKSWFETLFEALGQASPAGVT